MRQTPENRRAVQEGIADYMQEEKIPHAVKEQQDAALTRRGLIALSEHIPQHTSETTDYYFVDMFESKLIKLPEGKTVVIETKYLYTCTAIALFMEDDEGERFCLLSHFPYYLGKELDDEMLRHDVSFMEGLQKKAAVVVPAHSNENSREERSVREMLRKYGIKQMDINVYSRTNAPLDSYEEYDGKVTVRWEPASDPVMSYLDQSGSWVDVHVDVTKESQEK